MGAALHRAPPGRHTRQGVPFGVFYPTGPVGSTIISMMQRTGHNIILVALALVVGVFTAPSAFSAAPPRIVSTLEVGGSSSAAFTGRVSAYRWVMCASVSGRKCLRRVKIGNTKTIVVPASAAGRPLMVSVKVKKRWVNSAWSRKVAAAKPAAAPVQSLPAAPALPAANSGGGGPENMGGG